MSKIDFINTQFLVSTGISKIGVDSSLSVFNSSSALKFSFSFMVDSILKININILKFFVKYFFKNLIQY